MKLGYSRIDLDKLTVIDDEQIKEAVYKDSKSLVNWTKVVTPRDYKIINAQLQFTINQIKAQQK